MTTPGGRTEDGSPRTWPPVVTAVALAVAGLAAIWFLAVPRSGVCPALYPAPPGCGTVNRVQAAWVASGGLAVALALSVLTLRTAARGRPGRCAGALIVLGLLGIALTTVVWLA